MTTELSPAAQAVLDATSGTYGNYQFNARRQMLAAALRAAAEVLREAYANERYPDHPDDFLFDIAAELEGQ